jgi:hypothetical protein
MMVVPPSQTPPSEVVGSETPHMQWREPQIVNPGHCPLFSQRR